jgi:hypothetical protein
MPIKFLCPQCHNEIVVKYVRAGEQAQCKSCHASVTVPADTENVAADYVPRPAPAVRTDGGVSPEKPAPPASPTGDTFNLLGGLRFQLYFNFIGSLALIGILVWAVSSPYMELTKIGPLILVALIAFAIWELVQIVKWANFRVTLTKDGITARDTFIRWADVDSATAKTSSRYQTFIEIHGSDGKIIQIPAGVEQSAFVLSVCEKYIPNLKKEG